MRIAFRDATGKILNDFSGIIALSLPKNAGNIDMPIVKMTNGYSELFHYTPGTIAGKYNLTMSIPGMGTENAVITVIPEKPMYIEYRQDNSGLVFSLRDRYGNLSPFSGDAVFVMDETETPISIKNQSIIRISNPKAGNFTFEIPEMAKNSIEFKENGQTETIFPVFKITGVTYTQGEGFAFHDDYNARYTVLAGGSFLREAENILYGSRNASPEKYQKSESLAATTLLASPYNDSSLFTIFPSGAYTIGKQDSALIHANLTLENGYPKLLVSESVRQMPIAEVLYKTKNAEFRICQEVKCDFDSNKNTIIAKSYADSRLKWQSISGNLILRDESGQNIISVDQTGQISAHIHADIKNHLDSAYAGVVLDIFYENQKVGQLQYVLSARGNITLIPDTDDIGIFSVDGDGAPILRTIGHEATPTSHFQFGSMGRGYSIAGSVTDLHFDEAKIGPTSLDDIGTLSENP